MFYSIIFLSTLWYRKEDKMSEQTKKKIKLIYTSLLSVLLIITGILLVAACVSIYRLGDRPFTVENISNAFSKIAIPVWITVGAVVVGAVLALVFPEKERRLKAKSERKVTLSRMLCRLDRESTPYELISKIEKEENLRKSLRISAICLSVIALIPALIYSLNLKNFTADYNVSVIAACTLLLPCSLIAAGIFVVYLFLEDASYLREIDIVKTALAEHGAKPSEKKDMTEPDHRRTVWGLRIAIAAVSLVFIVLGILNGGMADVLAKAAAICTECIGLG